MPDFPFFPVAGGRRRFSGPGQLALRMVLLVAVALPVSPAWSESPAVVAAQEDATDTDPASDAKPAGARPGINLFRLLVRGGWFMLPLLLVSLAAAGITVERLIALQRDRLMPERMIQRLARLGQQPGGLDPRDAWLVCQGTPSVAADVFRSVLVKVGRPHMELEHACTESAQRAAIRLQQPVSWLTLCAALAPLIGLLGTVWGITQAFYDMTQLDVGQNRADALARGIYVALVTTIAGLTIAIPCTMMAHWFENRIVTLMNRIEEMVRGILPQLERYEGVVRFSPAGFDDAGTGAGPDDVATAVGGGNNRGDGKGWAGGWPTDMPVPAPHPASRPRTVHSSPPVGPRPQSERGND